MIDNEIKIAVLENQFEAQLLSSILTERDIPHQLRSYHDTAYNGLFQATKGWGAVYASELCKKEITEILDEIRTKRLDMDGETDLDME
jgi:hypothetical protein